MPTPQSALEQQQQKLVVESVKVSITGNKHQCRAGETTTAAAASVVDDAAPFQFDDVFAELGEFGRHQKIVYAYVCMAMLLYGQVTLTYVFTAGDLNYRCHIPEMKEIGAYQTEWLSKVLPLNERTGMPEKCQRYADAALVVEAPPTQSSFFTSASNASNPARFVVECNEFVYETSENNILRQFHLQCSGNDWKRSMVGSANNAALFIGLPMMGFLSDRCGRKSIFIWGLFACGLVGLLKSFMQHYVTFVALEVLDAFLGSGTFMGAYVLAMELVGPTKRTLCSAVLNCFYTAGVMLLGVYAHLIADYRVWLRVCYAPTLLVLVLLWTLPESTRWLFSMNRRADGARNIVRAARVNGVALSARFQQKLRSYCEKEAAILGADDDDDDAGVALKSEQSAAPTGSPKFCESGVMVLRMLSCSICWFVHAFVTYGLTMNAVDVAASANKHWNFILMSFIELPACLLMNVVMQYMGRRASLSMMMLLSAGACVGTMLSVGGQQFVCFLFGKFAITASFSVLYVFTAEIFPTSMRNGLMSGCSMVARLGAMLGPQMTLLARYWSALPLIMYTGSAVAAAAMVLLCFPETFNAKLPDTLEEALNVGRRKKRTTNQTNV